ncbi:MAG TPA: low affinity iron permease family protein [Pyrinomonadaceae bacterium]|jgi:low affinity Fe/Cu permease|nr:low affinity iron permease family protein [Pyrinomonadaceae bacterium]
MNEFFRKFAHQTSHLAGTAWAFILAVLLIVVWALTGPMFGYSDTWQLVINTSTTVITFLMVFLIQNTQNRDAKAIHLKLDELIKATKGARNHMIDLENLSDEQLRQLEEEYKRICALGDEEEIPDEVHAGHEAVKEELDSRESTGAGK